MKPLLTGMLPDELAVYLAMKPEFRAKQVFEWIHKGITSFQEMTNLPQDLRESLKDVPVLSSEISKEAVSEDGTSKITLKLYDGSFIESVLLIDDTDRKTACLSSQAGCAMGCTFCKTATMGLLRNLTAGEIVEQFLHLQAKYGNISNIVFMGMGEPMANLDEVIKSIEILHHPKGQNIGLRKITISTSGITRKIRELANTELPVRLAVSLISADESVREELMPVAGKEPLKQLKESLIYFQRKTKKRITMEYVLMAGINDRKEDAIKLRHFVDDLKVIVNIIPWNPVEDLPYQEPDEKTVNSFITMLEDLSIPVTKRYLKGRSVNGACGQLAVLQNSSDSSDTSRT
ncbi:MAG: 23S rRNA (adenine(2503)-C(2))-methyltransferase RlmN [Spirochaetia bacterium]|jgi:23S rRNA (adenine2503-C2)-methyltransferase|nr:23S rRNA (adenine(2503)-C(2))-methyltransferase RlmN [Spirochaetia bacterium]